MRVALTRYTAGASAICDCSQCGPTLKVIISNVLSIALGAVGLATLAATVVALAWWRRRRLAGDLPHQRLVELAPEAMMINCAGHFVYANAAAAELLGARSPGELIGKRPFDILHPDTWEVARARMDALYAGQRLPPVEQRYLRFDGAVVDVEVLAVPLRFQGRPSIQIYAREIGERKAAERRAERLSSLYTALALIDQTVVRARDRSALLDDACRIAVEYGHLQTTWVGLVDGDGWRVRPVAASGPGAAYAHEAFVTLDAERPEGRGPFATAMRSGRPYVCNDFSADPATLPWRALAGKYGFRAVAVFPLHAGGQPIGAMAHYAAETGFFEPDLVDLLARMADDISFALDRLESERQREAAEAALAGHQRMLATLMSNLPGMVYRCRNDEQWTMEFVSEGCLELIGYRAEDLVGNKLVSFNAVIHPQDRQRVAQEIRVALTAGDRFALEYRLVRRNGEERWVFERGVGMRNAAGEVDAFEGFITDITARRRAEETLVLFRAAMETAADAIFLTDFQTLGYIDVNETACRMLGYTREALLALTVPDVNADVSEAEVRRRFEATRARGAEGISEREDRFLRRKDGSVFPIEVYRRWFRVGDRELIVSVARDISERKRTEEALLRFRTAIDMARDAILLIDRETMRYIDVNQTACQLFGYRREEMLQLGPSDLNPGLPPGELEQRLDEAIALAGQPTRPESDGRFNRRRDGSVFPVEVYRVAIRVGSRDIIVAFTRDITERLQGEEALRLRDRAIEASTNAIIITSRLLSDNPIVYVNPAFESITGYSAAESVGRNCRFLQGAQRDQPALNDLRAALRENRDAQVILQNYRKDGGLFWSQLTVSPVRDAGGRVTHHIGIAQDITESVQYREQLEHQANHDTLTGLPNRNLMRDRLAQGIAYAQRHGCVLATVFIDLDNFKLINDTLGHRAGDALLQEAALRLRQCVREDDTVARLGGDEFVVLLNDQPSKESVTQAVHRLVKVLSRPISVEGHEITSTCSIGISLFPSDGGDGETLLKHADAAMYRAKAAGRNTFQFFSVEMNEELSQRLAMEASLRRALARDEFRVHFQTRIGLESGRVEGVEALIRWQSQEFGLVSPARFIPVAEDTGLIVPIGDWVLRAACRQMREWHERGLPKIPVSVNISPRQFKRRELVSEIAEALAQSGLEPRFLEIEVTESLVMENAEQFVTTLHALKKLGIEISVDDFGTGYSSLNYLKRFPVDRLKVDQSFVRDIGADPGDAAIVQAIVQLGHSLGLQVTAEGVESEVQLEFLRGCGCDQVQGYLFSKPLPADQVAALLGEAR
jgi:diguanylate cyclase (GGDEF)-like protein/PAS domain S-box-containing protein